MFVRYSWYDTLGTRLLGHSYRTLLRNTLSMTLLWDTLGVTLNVGPADKTLLWDTLAAVYSYKTLLRGTLPMTLSWDALGVTLL